MSDGERTPARRAVALSYDGKGAPRVSARGEGHVAERIVDVAREHGVPLHSDSSLSAFLARVPVGDEVPEALYLAVAQVLAFAYRVTDRAPPAPQRDAAADGPGESPAQAARPSSRRGEG